MTTLADMKISGYGPDARALTNAEIADYRAQVGDWSVQEVDGTPHLQRIFKFKDFKQALAFTNAVGNVAEQLDHHPAITTEWGKVTVAWWTHKVGGLHKNDFIAAAKTDQLYDQG